MRKRERLTVTVDPQLIQAAEEGNPADAIVTSDPADLETLVRVAGRLLDLIET